MLPAAAFWVPNKGRKSGFKLYTYFCLMSLGMSVILGNNPIILSGTVFLVYSTKVAEVEPLAFSIAEFASGHIGSMVFFDVVLCKKVERLSSS